MALRGSITALVAALVLTACGTLPSGQFATAAANPPTTAQPTQAPAPTIAQVTKAPALTIAPQPTAAGKPTQAAAPTALPEPTQASQPTAPPTHAPAPSAASTSTATSTAAGGELLFLRQGTLVALDPAKHKQRPIADSVLDFAATPNGKMIALVRDVERVFELWVVQRDGSGLRQITSNGNDRIEGTPVWSPDGAALAYAAADSSDAYARTWLEWSAWCGVSEVHVFDIGAGADRSFGPGCDPAFSPDGKRIAYATRPSTRQEGANSRNATNTIRLINRQGQNGWNFAAADGSVDPASPKRGMLVYAPAFSPDGKQLRSATLLQLSGTHDIALPTGELTAVGQVVGQLPRAQAAAWSPDGATLAVLLPPGWKPGLPFDQPVNADEKPGEIWSWKPGGDPVEKLAENVDFASPVLWLPAMS